MKPSILAVTSITLLSNGVNAWGPVAHQTIARLALRYALPDTVTWLTQLLPNQGSTDDSMAWVSTWPDGYAHQCADGLWTKSLHFIDAEDITPKNIDHPPLTCDVEYERDCSNGLCVVGAIQNYTSIIQQQSSFSNVHTVCGDQASSGQKKPPKRPKIHAQIHDFTAKFSTQAFPPLDPEDLSDAQLALRFIVHFIGDTHQPLHAKGYDLGGNRITPVYFNKREGNLHAFWDSQIPEAIFRRLPGGTKGTVDYLYQHINKLDKASNDWKTNWVGKCFDGIEQEVATDNGISPTRSATCAMQWAEWANHYICSYVLQYGTETVGMELGGEYTNKAEPIIVELISMAGWRLGGWLNLLATGKLGVDLGSAGAGSADPDEDSFRGKFTAVPEQKRDEL